jgi:predicted esterase
VASARLAAICVHGRGSSASNILLLADQLGLDDVAFLAPEADGNTWYPQSFLAPIDSNEPGISSALRRMRTILDDLQRAGFGPERVAMLGFSQGACLTLEFAARNATRFAAVAGLSGGLIGPPGTPRNYPGSMAGTPVFLGCSDIDAHIPLERVHETAAVFTRLRAVVDERIYPQGGHTVNDDEIAAVRRLLQ